MLISFLFLHENICCGYLLEVPQRGASNEYPQHMFSWRNKKNIMWIPHLICSYGFMKKYIPKKTYLNKKQSFKKKRNLSFLSHLLVAGCDIGVRFSVRPSVRPSVSPSVRLSTFMSTFDIYVKVSILINYKTKQPSNFAWNISLTSWLCDIGVRFSVCLSIRLSVCQHLCRRSTFMSKLVF